MISAIVAADQNMAIGVNGGMLCHIPGDLKYFKNVTMGATVVVGRKTYDGLPVKPLPGREHIVITRAADESLTPVQPQVCKTNLQGAINFLQAHKDENVFVIGGSNGLSDAVLARADARLSFSNLTFPHGLMRVILLEQLYRAERIRTGEPYHK